MSWTRRVRNVFRRRRLDEEIDEELRSHLDMRTADLERAGLPAPDARREAIRLLGNPLSLRDRTREEDVWVHLETALQDVRYAIRLLWRSPSFTVAATLTLTLGIGVNTAMFGVLYGVLLRPLPYPEADRLFVLYQTSSNAGRTRAAPLDYADWRRRSRTFDMAGVVGTGFTLTGTADPELVIGQLVAGDFFDLLGVRPLHGRVFGAAEQESGEHNVMVLSHRLWQRRYGGDPGVVGSTVTANGRVYTVVGVMPPKFSFRGDRYELWVPFPSTASNPDKLPINRSSRYVQVIGRLKPGITREAADEDLSLVAASLAREYPETHESNGIAAVSLTQETVGDVRRGLQLLFAAVLLVLMIACGNVTSLLLARIAVRGPEVQIRAALGASRARVIRQLLTETLVLYGLGTVLGVAAADWVLWLVRAFGTGALPRLADISLMPQVVLFAALTSLAAAVVFGIVPAWQATNLSATRSAGRTITPGRPTTRFRSAIVVAQIAISLCLLSGASLVARSLANLQTVEKGFDPNDRLTFNVVMPATRFPSADAMRAFYRQMVDAVSTQPGFRKAGTTTHLPLSGQDLENSFTVEGYVPPSPDREPIAALRGVSPDYFAALGVTLRAGRTIAATDTERSAPVAVVNEAFARRYFAGDDPIGRRLSVGGNEGKWHTVVGLVADVRHRGLGAEARPEVLLPYVQLDDGFAASWARGLSFVVHTDMGFAAAAATIRRAVRNVDASTPVIELRPMSELVSQSVAEPRFRTYLLAAFAAIAVALAAVGVFGVLSFVVSERTREIGVRLALGASPQSIFRDVLLQAARLVVSGTAIGLAAGALLARRIESLLFQVSPGDPGLIAAASLVLVAVALLAAYLPARRATRVDPLTALRT